MGMHAQDAANETVDNYWDTPSRVELRRDSNRMATVHKQRPRPLKRKKLSPKRPAPAERDTSSGFCGGTPTSAVVFGPSGVGKTSFIANMPKCGFIIDPKEQGVSDLVEFGQCPEPEFTEEVENWEMLMGLLDSLASDARGIKNLAIDSATGFELLCHIFHCNENFDGDWSKQGFLNFSQGPKAAAKTDWPKFLDALDLIRQSEGVNIWLIAHSQLKTFNNPEGPDYDRFIPYLDKETWAQTHRWAKMVLFYNFHTDVTEGKGPKKKANLDNDQRFIYTTRTAAFDAKNRHGLTPLVDAGETGKEAYEAFRDAYKDAMRKSKRKE